MAERTTSGLIRRPIYIIENVIIVWLHTNPDEMNNSISQLYSNMFSIRTFTECDACINFITDIKDQKTFLILSWAYVETLVPVIHNIPQLSSIYIYGDDQSNYEKWSTDWRKIRGIFPNISSICNQLKRNIRECEHDFTSISILQPSGAVDLNELDQSFMYTGLLKEILLDIKYNTDVNSKELIHFCHSISVDNDFEKDRIDEFKRNYRCHSPIWWYTKESFIYSTLNRALREQDNGILIKMGFFIQDLHRQIEHLHSRTSQTTKIIIYRGQAVSKTNFNKMMISKGGFLSFNCFLSTSSERAVSLAYAESSQCKSESMSILFRIEADTSVSNTPFAPLDNISYYSDSEKEILFSMHTVFRIGEMNKIDENLWEVNLSLTNDTDDQLKHLTEHMRIEIKGQTGWHRLGLLMCKIGEYDKAEEIYCTLLETTVDNNRSDLPVIYGHLGYIYSQKDDLTNALIHYKQSLDIILENPPWDDHHLSAVYTGIGLTLKRKGDYNGSLEYYQHALNVELHSQHPNYLNIVTISNNIGGLLDDQGNHVEALKYLKNALEVAHAHLPSRHPSLATTYNNIGLVYHCMRQYSTALPYYEKTLEIRQKSLPPNHPALAMLHHNIAMTLADIGRYKEAVDHISMAVSMARQTFRPDHPQVQTFQKDFDALLLELHSKANS